MNQSQSCQHKLQTIIMSPLVRLLSVFLFSFSFFSGDVVLLTNEWELVEEKDGIKVYTRNIVGKDFKELKMHGVIKGQSLSSFVALFHDIDSYDKWVYSFGEAKVLKHLSETEMIYYLRSDFPWPLSDRDFVVKNKIWQDSGTLAFHSQSEIYHEFLDENSDCVRVQEFEATWVITPSAKGEFHLDYTFYTDPGGNIPAWLVNSFLDVGPLHTVENLEKTASEDQYKKVSFSFITEPDY